MHMTSITSWKPSPWIKHNVNRIFAAASDEEFHAGMNSRFSEELQRLGVYDSRTVLHTLKIKLKSPKEDFEVLAEMLRWVSFQDAASIRGIVSDILKTGLRHDVPLVRDAAASGLAWLEGVKASLTLRQAAETETVPELKKDFENLIRSLDT